MESCPTCNAPVAAVTAEVDPQTIGHRYLAQCGHQIPAAAAHGLWSHHGYRWTVPAVDGASLAAAERRRHVTVEGHTPESDAERSDDLAWSAWAYVDAAMNDTGGPVDPPVMWPGDPADWKTDASPIRRLVIAASLIEAEIDRRLIEQRSRA